MKPLQTNNRRFRVRFAAFIALFVLVLFGSVLLGQYRVSLQQLGRLLLGQGDETAAQLLINYRIPRIIAAAAVGAALSLAGVCYQGMFANPMVSPDILGASSGAGFGAALAILLGASYYGIASAAFVTGLAAVALAYGISRISRTKQIIAMILAGMMVSSLFSAGTSFLKLVADTESQLPAITYWLMGSLSDIRLKDLLFLLVPLTLGGVPLFLLRWRINLLTLGEEEASAMGINTSALRLVVVVCATLLTAACVSVSGIIGWVGLVIPHFCRMLFGYDYRRLIPASVLLGGLFLMVVDNVARLATTAGLPLGILTAFVGAPVFLYLVITGGANREA